MRQLFNFLIDDLKYFKLIIVHNLLIYLYQANLLWFKYYSYSLIVFIRLSNLIVFILKLSLTRVYTFKLASCFNLCFLLSSIDNNLCNILHDHFNQFSSNRCWIIHGRTWIYLNKPRIQILINHHIISHLLKWSFPPMYLIYCT